MPTWNPDNVILTSEGQRVLALLSAGKGSITITNIKIGLYVDPQNPNIEELPLITEIQNIATTIKAEIASITSMGSFSNLEISVENTVETTKVTNFCQIGIYATYSEEGNEFLYMVAQCDSGDYEQMPIYSETPTALFYNLKIYHGYDKGIKAEIAENSYINPYRIVNLENKVENLGSQVVSFTDKKLYLYLTTKGEPKIKFQFKSSKVDKEEYLTNLESLGNGYYCCNIPFNAGACAVVINNTQVSSLTLIPSDKVVGTPLLAQFNSSFIWADYIAKRAILLFKGYNYFNSSDTKVNLSYTYNEGEDKVTSTSQASFLGDSVSNVSDTGVATYDSYFIAHIPLSAEGSITVTYSNGSNSSTFTLALKGIKYCYSLFTNGNSIEEASPIRNVGAYSLITKGDNKYAEDFSNFATKIILNSGDIIYDTSETLSGYNYPCKEVNVGTCCTEIGSDSFNVGTVDKVTIPNTVEYIGDNSFTNAKLVFIDNFPSALEIGDNSFTNSLVKYKYKNEGSIFYTEMGYTVDYSSELTNIPSTVRPESVVKVLIGKNVSKLGNYALSKLESLTKVVFEDSDKDLEIGNYAFYACPNLQEITIPHRVKKIGSYFLSGSKITKNILIDNFPNSIEVDATTFNNSLHNIYYKYLTEQQTVDTVMSSTSSNAVANRTIKSYIDSAVEPASSVNNKETRLVQARTVYNYFNANIPTVDSDANISSTNALSNMAVLRIIANADNATVVLNSNKEVIFIDPYGTSPLTERQFRWNSDVSEVYIGSANVFVPTECFLGCSNLSKLVIKEGVQGISNSAFWNTNSLTDIKLPCTVTQIGNKAFGSSSSGITGTNVLIMNSKNNISMESDSFPSTAVIAYTNTIIEGDTVLHNANLDINAHYIKEGSKVTIYFTSVSSSALTKVSGSSMDLTLPFEPCNEFTELVSTFNKSGYAFLIKEMIAHSGGKTTLFLDSTDSSVTLKSTGINGGTFSYFTSE